MYYTPIFKNTRERAGVSKWTHKVEGSTWRRSDGARFQKDCQGKCQRRRRVGRRRGTGRYLGHVRKRSHAAPYCRKSIPAVTQKPLFRIIASGASKFSIALLRFASLRCIPLWILLYACMYVCMYVCINTYFSLKVDATRKSQVALACNERRQTP